MNPRVLTALLIATLSGCAATTPEVYGVWTVPDIGKGPYSFAHYAYMEDGRKCAVLFDDTPNGMKLTAFLNQWEMDGDVVTLTYGPNNSIIPEGHVSKSRVNELTDSRFVYTIFEPVYPDMEPEVSVRLPSADPDRVCALAQFVLIRQ
jgi:hypothetical protein